MVLQVVEGDLLKADTRYIAHQCNCVTWKAAHLSRAVFNTFPHADVYSPRKQTAHHDTPGTIKICGGNGNRFVVNMFGQYYPGKPRWANSKRDGYKAREKYFSHCLLHLIQYFSFSDMRSIAFPYGIGCGAAGGNWDEYFNMLKAFANAVKGDVYIYRLEK